MKDIVVRHYSSVFREGTKKTTAMPHSVRFVIDDDYIGLKERVLKSATAQSRTIMVANTPLQSGTPSTPRRSQADLGYARKRQLLQTQSAESRPNSPQHFGYSSLRRTVPHGIVRQRVYHSEYGVRLNDTPFMLLPKARVRAHVDMDMFGGSLREGSVIPVDPSTTLQLSTMAAVFNPAHGAYAVRNPRWDRPMAGQGVSGVKSGHLRYQQIVPSRPSSVGEDSLSSPEPESNSERAPSVSVELAPEYPEEFDSLFPATVKSGEEGLPAHLDNYAKETEVKLLGRRRNTIANIPVSNLPNLGREKKISVDFPPVNYINGVANYLDWIFTTFGDVSILLN